VCGGKEDLGEEYMTITKLNVATAERFADGYGFGDAGPYFRVYGVARGELDPAARENTVIADLDTAERNTRGMVEYETDFFILRPAEPRRGSGVLVYDVTNRGRKVILGRLDEAGADADRNNPKTPRDPGLGFTLGRGYTLVWSGWDPGALPANNGMTARFPTTLENGKPMIRRIRDEFHIGTRTPGRGDLVPLNYAAVSTDPRRARLTVRERESDQRREIPADHWEFVDARTIRLLPEGTLFDRFKIYEVWYEATNDHHHRTSRRGGHNPQLFSITVRRPLGVGREAMTAMSHRLSLRLDLSDDLTRATAVVPGGSPDVGNWHLSDAAGGAELIPLCPAVQTSTCSAMARASSTSMPR
jgi:hypothetical protein